MVLDDPYLPSLGGSSLGGLLKPEALEVTDRRDELEGTFRRDCIDPGRRSDALDEAGERSGRTMEEVEDPCRVKTGAEEEEKELKGLVVESDGWAGDG